MQTLANKRVNPLSFVHNHPNESTTNTKKGSTVQGGLSVMFWGRKEETPTEIYKVGALRTLYDYDPEFAPGKAVYKALEYLKPLARVPINLYREALNTNDEVLLAKAKEGLRKAFRHLDFYF